MLWNTIYIEKALNKLRHDGYEIKEEDIPRIAPLKHEHINFLGRYSFSMTEQIEKGELRDLNDPTA